MTKEKKCREMCCPYADKISVQRIKDYLKVRIEKNQDTIQYKENRSVAEYLNGKINADKQLLTWIEEAEALKE